MTFAVVGGVKQRATKGAVGTCPLCDELLVPKCGNYRIHHWSHKKGSDCDSWSEGETEWHLDWKSYFHVENQEVTVLDELTGEKHRADIKTDNGMVIELQHSPIKDEDIEVRTRFYGRMFWIVDGTNFGFLDHDFFLGLKFRPDSAKLMDFTYYGYGKFFEKWGKVSAPVFVDFKKEDLYWIKSYNAATKRGVVQLVSRVELVERNGGITQQSQDSPKAVSEPQKRKTYAEMNQFERMVTYHKSKRFRF